MPSAPALREHADVARRRHSRGEGRVEAGVRRGVDHAEAVRADQAHPCRPADLDELVLGVGRRRRPPPRSRRSAPPASAPPGRRRPAPPPAPPPSGRRPTARSTPSGRSCPARGSRESLHLGGRWLTTYSAPGVSAVAQVVEHLAADGARAPRRADDRHRRRGEHAPHHRRRRGALAVLEGGRRRGRGDDGKRTKWVPRSLRNSTGKPTRPEHVDHPVVPRHHLGVEQIDAGGVGVLGEVGEQQGPESPALEVVGDGERDLRHPPAGLADVLGVTHDAPGDPAEHHQGVVAGAPAERHVARRRPGSTEPKKRWRRAPGDRPSRNAVNAPRSSGRTGGRGPVEPSRSSTSTISRRRPAFPIRSTCITPRDGRGGVEGTLGAPHSPVSSE